MMSGILCQVLTLYFNAMFHSHSDPTTGQVPRPVQGGGSSRGPARELLWRRTTGGTTGTRSRSALGIDLPYWLFVLPRCRRIVWGPNKMHEVKVA